MRSSGCSFALLLLVSIAAGDAFAHEVRPGYLELRELGEETYDALWKVPAKAGKRLALYVRLPPACKGTEPQSRFVGGAFLERWRATCEGGLAGSLIRIDGLAGTRTDVLVRIERADASSQTIRLTPDEPEFRVAAAAGPWEVSKTYFELGVEHILLGIDHLLFVLALMFLARSWPRLIGTVTSFTLAHSLTLSAATLGWLHVPQSPVEATIALSILFVAVEILHARKGQPGLAAKKPWIVAFIFGLLHGLGFAGALRDVGLPEHAVPLALAFFNIGVEAGQLLFIAAFFTLIWAFARLLPAQSVTNSRGTASATWSATAGLALPTAYVIGSLASFWLIERTVGFWG